MNSVQLTFKKLGNHWYLDIPHNDPSDLILDPKMERMLNRIDTWNNGYIDSIFIEEQTGFIDTNGLIQFKDSDILRYFTTNDKFEMSIFINNHEFIISSTLYFLLEQKYQFDFHELVYKVCVFKY